MSGPSRRALVRAVRRLSADEHTALLVALCRERDGPTTACTTGEPSAGDVPGDGREPDPAETARALLYAVDRRTADRLCRAHLDRSLADLYLPEREDPAGDGDDGRAVSSVGVTLSALGRWAGSVASGPGLGPEPGRRATTLVVVVVALSVTGAAVPTLEALSADARSEASGTAVATPVPIETLDDRSTGAIDPGGGGRLASAHVPGVTQSPDGESGVGDPSASRTDDDLPTSLTADGVTSAGELAAVHALAVANRSYVWRVTYRERTEGGVRAVRWETVRVERPGRYRTTVTGWGSLAARTTPISSVEAFGDGERRLVRRSDGNATTYRSDPVLPQGSLGRYAIRASRLVRWHVAGEPTRIASRTRVGDRTYYLVYAGEGYDSATPETWLTVDDEGMVHAFHTRYPVGGSNATAVVSFEYTDVGATTVGRPTWYGDAIEATGTPAPTDTGPDAIPAASADDSREARPSLLGPDHFPARPRAERLCRGGINVPASMTSPTTDRSPGTESPRRAGVVA